MIVRYCAARRRVTGFGHPFLPAERPAIISDEVMAPLERVLVQVIWGKRIGSLKLFDGKTPLWNRSPYAWMHY
jgi:hypothetical protein